MLLGGGLRHEMATTSSKMTFPIDLPALGAEMVARLRSRGGRPSLIEATRRQKIPLRHSDWEALEAMARELTIANGRTITPAQIASHLLTRTLSEPPLKR